MDQERLERIAHARTLHFGIAHDVGRHARVGGGVDVDVAHSLVVLEHRNSALLSDRADETLPTTRNHEVDVLILLE